MCERSFSRSRVFSESDCGSRAWPYTTAGTRPAARSLRATPLPVSVRVSPLRDADAMMIVLDDASSTAANHDPGATLRRLRPSYHAGVSLGETDRGWRSTTTAVHGLRFTVYGLPPALDSSSVPRSYPFT